MKEDKVVLKGYVINGFKFFSQLALEYFPGYSTLSGARKQMRERIDQNLSLTLELNAVGYTCHTTHLSPRMQEIIFQHWGPPHIVLPGHHPEQPIRIER